MVVLPVLAKLTPLTDTLGTEAVTVNGAEASVVVNEACDAPVPNHAFQLPVVVGVGIELHDPLVGYGGPSGVPPLQLRENQR